MANQNGQLILRTLEKLEEPSTVGQISQYIADTVGGDMKDIKESIKNTLDAGVQYGYVQRASKKYFSAPLDVDELMDDVLPNDQNGEKMKGSEEMNDRTTRRRRKSRRVRRLGTRRRSSSRRRSASRRRGRRQ